MAILSEYTLTEPSGIKTSTIYKVLNDQSADETTSDVIDVFGAHAVGLMIRTNGTVTSGNVILEGSVENPDTGTWLNLRDITTNVSNAYLGETADVEDNAINLHACRYIRARIETVIGGGGTIDVWITVVRI